MAHARVSRFCSAVAALMRNYKAFNQDVANKTARLEQHETAVNLGVDSYSILLHHGIDFYCSAGVVGIP